MHRVVLAAYFVFSLAAAPGAAPAPGPPLGVQEFVDPLGAEPLEPIGATTAGAAEAASSTPEPEPPTTAPGPTPDPVPTLPDGPAPAVEPDPPTTEPAPTPTTESAAGPSVAVATEAASPEAAAALLLEDAPSAVSGSVGLDDLVIEPEGLRPSPLPDRPRWTDAVDAALGWRADDCKFAYYAVGPRDCRGNVHRDHLVAWAEAWDSGLGYADAEGWYLDDDNLWVMPAGENISKSDEDPAEWRPQDRADWCRYASDWIAVKAAWNLTADRAEAGALREMLSTCTGAPPPELTADIPPPEPADDPPDAAPPPEPADDSSGQSSANPDPDLDELLQEIRSTPCGQWGAEERALAQQAPAGFDWGRRDGDNDGNPCDI